MQFSAISSTTPAAMSLPTAPVTSNEFSAALTDWLTEARSAIKHDPRTAAANLTADPDRGLAEVLLDQRVMAGVGNVYCNTLCFVTGHLPTAPVSAVNDPLRMVQRARDMLWLNRSRWNRTTTGDTRGGRELWVYGRDGKPCRRCGTAIKRDGSGDRVRYWCPNCQQ